MPFLEPLVPCPNISNIFHWMVAVRRSPRGAGFGVAARFHLLAFGDLNQMLDTMAQPCNFSVPYSLK
jgi:hypothetical protein